MLRQLKKSHHIATLLCAWTLVAAAGWLIARGKKAEAQPSLYASLPRPPAPWKTELDWNKVRADEAGFIQVLHDGGRVELTLDPRLQQMAERVLETATKAAQKLAEKPAAALRASKRLLKREIRERLDEAGRLEVEEFAARVRSAEAKQAFEAFFNKRRPQRAGQP